ncbi:MAG TPA: hypothetical protein VHS31_12785 [Tepidisphaeraceae bacterium]|jgi:hypothetical protein|nr:hypothetical protein [Tepidisphaeraceae bacterium]
MKKILPISLIILGTLLLSGCFFVPAFNPTISGKDVSDKVGGPASNRPLRVGTVTMDQVIALLGQPQYVSRDDRQIAYTWEVLNGEWVYPLCFTAQPQHGERALELTFDQQNVLVDYRLSKEDGSLQLFVATAQGPPVAANMVRYPPWMKFVPPATKPARPPGTEKTP